MAEYRLSDDALAEFGRIVYHEAQQHYREQVCDPEAALLAAFEEVLSELTDADLEET